MQLAARGHPLHTLGSPDEPTRAESDEVPLLDALLNLTPATPATPGTPRGTKT